MIVNEKPKRLRGPKIPRLTSVARIGAEIGKLYRLMRREELNTSDGKRMAEVLLAMKSCLETAEIEAKIAELERAFALQKDNVTSFRRSS
jgi:hypothetical protein